MSPDMGNMGGRPESLSGTKSKYLSFGENDEYINMTRNRGIGRGFIRKPGELPILYEFCWKWGQVPTMGPLGVIRGEIEAYGSPIGWEVSKGEGGIPIGWEVFIRKPCGWLIFRITYG